MRAPTPRQLAILRFIRESQPAPTVREIGARFGIDSTNAVMDHLKSLQRKGLLQWTPRKSRGLKATPAGLVALGETCCPCRDGCSCECHEKRDASNDRAFVERVSRAEREACLQDVRRVIASPVLVARIEKAIQTRHVAVAGAS